MNVRESDFEVGTSSGELVRGRFRDTGEGPVGIYVHGLLSDGEGAKSMHLWEDAIAKGRSWLRFDQRGQGRSEGTFNDFRISRVAEDLRCVLDFVGNRPTVLVGSSLGGWIAGHAGLTWSHNICGIILIAPAFNFIEDLYRSLTPHQAKRWEKDGRHLFASDYQDGGFSLEFATVQDARGFDVYAAPIRYRCPVVVLHGESDDVVPVETSMKFKSAAESQISVEVVAGGDHRLSEHSATILRHVDAMWLAN